MQQCSRLSSTLGIRRGGSNEVFLGQEECPMWVKLGPRAAVELGPLYPQQQTSQDRPGLPAVGHFQKSALLAVADSVELGPGSGLHFAFRSTKPFHRFIHARTLLGDQ